MPADTIHRHRARVITCATFMLAALASSLLSSCRASDTVALDAPKVVRLELASPRGSISPGETLQLAANATDSSGLRIVGLALEWSSSSPAVATVDRTGLVRGGMPGTTRVVASAGAIAASIEITVCVSSGTLRVVGPSAVAPGGSAPFKLGATPGACVAEATVTTWTSSDPTIASIDTGGVLSALRVGKVTVSATRLGVTVAAAQVVVTTSLGQIAFVDAGTLMLMPVDGVPSPIVQLGGASISTTRAAISPDGRTVAFDCRIGICYTAVTGGATPLTLISGGRSPSWGANGIEVAAWMDHAEVGIADVESGRVDHLRTPRYAERPRLSPDGTEVAFECDYLDPYGELSDVCIISVRNGALLTVIDHASTVAWSPDGTRLAYMRDGLCVAPRDDPNDCTTIIAPRSGEPLMEAAWSPDGYRLVVARSDGLWIVSSDGTGLTLVHSSARGVTSPSWGLAP